MNPLPFVLVLIGFAAISSSARDLSPQDFEFVHQGNTLKGYIDLPTDGEASSLVVIVHGHGRSNVASGQWYDLRSAFTKIGIATCVWDKAGCGRSDGVYDHEQSIESSASELLSAVEALRSRSVPGSQRIGFWGISRAGWICPVAIAQDPTIAFWISVSGTDAKESFGYLLRSNFRIEGRSEDEAQSLYREWLTSNGIFQSGGSWSAYRAARRNLEDDPFYAEFFQIEQSEQEYLTAQAEFMASEREFDEETGLLLYVEDFPNVLRNVHCPVLAIFGEKDTSVDWRSALSLYQQRFEKEQLTVVRFPDGNHNLQKSVTGGFREMLKNSNHWNPCNGYYESMTSWLEGIGATAQ